jgi:hypothetical protein
VAALRDLANDTKKWHMKRLRNTSGIPDRLVREVIHWVAANLGITGFDVECRGSSADIAGLAYNRGSSYHTTLRPFVVLRVGRAFPRLFAPYQYAQHKGKRYLLADRTEALFYITHELRHLWQAAQSTDKRKSAPLPRFHGSRGKFSEVDTESYAIHSLRRWRKARKIRRISPPLAYWIIDGHQI